jgi:hypothetical protein
MSVYGRGLASFRFIRTTAYPSRFFNILEIDRKKTTGLINMTKQIVRKISTKFNHNYKVNNILINFFFISGLKYKQIPL